MYFILPKMFLFFVIINVIIYLMSVICTNLCSFQQSFETTTVKYKHL